MKRGAALLRRLAPLHRATKPAIGEGAVYLAAAGFEDRSLWGVTHARWLRGALGAIVLDYRPFDKRNKLRAMMRALGRATKVVPVTLQYHRLEPDGFPDRLLSHLASTRPREIVVDVTAMSKLAILLVLDVCRELNLSTTLLYAEARRYGPARAQFERARSDSDLHRPSIQIYSGVRGLVQCGRLASVAMQGQPTAAIAFMSFNELLTDAVLSALYPSRLFLINGRPPQHRWREEATAWIHGRLLEEWAEDNPMSKSGPRRPLRTTSTLDYRATFALLGQLYWQLASEHRIVLAPTGSKMQTLGVFLLRAIHPDVHIEYPTPRGFLDLYSTGVGRTWCLSLGRLGSLVSELAAIDWQQHAAIRPDSRPAGLSQGIRAH